MNPIFIVIGLLVVVALGIVVYIFMPNNAKGANQAAPGASMNLRAMVQAQRQQQKLGDNKPAEVRGSQQSLALAAARESELTKKSSQGSSGLTLEKKLKYAHLPISPLQFRAVQIIATLAIFLPVSTFTSRPIWFMVLFLTPKIVVSLLDMMVNVRFKRFDQDYPVLIMSYVSLLKTGMNTISGLEAAAKGLEPESLVRREVEILMERLRLGLTEEQAIGAFGEEVYHPELELFVQSLILSRRVGGTLSLTLERLAKQVRKRQQFRKQAIAAIGLEQSSIYMIAAIMSGLLVYLTVQSPELVIPALSHETGRVIFETGVMLIGLGFYWSKQVAKIKV